MYLLSHSGHLGFMTILLEEVPRCMYKTLDMIQILKRYPYMAYFLCFFSQSSQRIIKKKIAALCILINACKLQYSLLC